MLERLGEWDLQGLELINRTWRGELLDNAMPMLSRDPIFWGVIIGALVVHVILQGRGGVRRVPLPALFLLLALGTSDLAACVTKNVVDRPRPHNTLPDLRYFERGGWRQNPPDFTPIRSGGSAFYSAHASNSMAMVSMLAAVVPQAAPVLYLLPLGVGYSRLYLGKHYPSDILAGWLAGLLIGRLYGKLYRLTAARLRRRMRVAA